MRSGIFKGLWLPFDAPWGGLSARFLGTYEDELAPEILRFIQEGPPLVIDVGCAEGYYAVGIANKLPSSSVIAFDLDPKARKLCKRVARRNEARNVRVRGRVTPARLQRLLVPGALLVSDCEGYELDLLDPARVPKLLDTNILVELHERLRPGLSAAMYDRFRTSHEVSIIDARPKTEDRLPRLPGLTAQELEAAADEQRPTEPHPMQWAVMRPLRRP